MALLHEKPNREKGGWCCEWLDDSRHKHHILHDYSCFYALQEIGSPVMNVPGYIVYGNDHGRTAILCPREVNHFRRSWVDHERCTAIMVGSKMKRSVNMPHSGRDEEDFIEALETVRATLTEGRKAGATDFFFFFGGDLNIEFRLDHATRIFTALTASIGTECTDLNAEGAARRRSLVRKIAMAQAIESLSIAL